jgi:hypothetical protein
MLGKGEFICFGGQKTKPTVNVGVHLSNIIKVPMWDTSLFGTLQLFIQQNMKLKMSLEEGETSIAESLQRKWNGINPDFRKIEEATILEWNDI